MAAGKDTTDGARAEALAARFLESRGMVIRQRNFRVAGGEIDLICQDGKTLVFVEVRLRRHQGYGGALASIHSRKQQRILLAAQHYLLRHGEQDCRFDCVVLDELDAKHLQWLPAAFGADT